MFLINTINQININFSNTSCFCNNEISSKFSIINNILFILLFYLEGAPFEFSVFSGSMSYIYNLKIINQIYRQANLIMDSQLTLQNVLLNNLVGYYNVFDIIYSTVECDFWNATYAISYSKYVLNIFRTTISINCLYASHFYPYFLHAFACSVIIKNTTFKDSNENFGSFQLQAISFEQNMTFEITNCYFLNLKNDIGSPVNK